MLVALIGGGFGAFIAAIQVVGIRINSKQHGNSMAVIAEVRDDLRDVRDDLRDVKDDVRDVRDDLRDVKGRVSNLERIDVTRVSGQLVEET